MRNRAFRRHQTESHLQRRLSEDKNQHYNWLDCPCYFDPRTQARFKEQPKQCQHYGCCNQRRNDWQPANERLTMQERRFYCSGMDDYE